MATRKREETGPRSPVVRRDGRPRQRLAPDLEDLARGDSDRVRPPARRPRIRDDRAVALVPGVANRDARAVFDARVEQLEEDRAAHPDDADATTRLAEGLREILQMRLWRGGSLTGFDAMTEQLLDLPVADARALAGEAPAITDEAVAVWIRAEAGILDSGARAHVRIVRTEKGHERLVIETAVADAPEATRALADHLAQLRGDLGRR